MDFLCIFFFSPCFFLFVVDHSSNAATGECIECHVSALVVVTAVAAACLFTTGVWHRSAPQRSQCAIDQRAIGELNRMAIRSDRIRTADWAWTAHHRSGRMRREWGVVASLRLYLGCVAHCRCRLTHDHCSASAATQPSAPRRCPTPSRARRHWRPRSLCRHGVVVFHDQTDNERETWKRKCNGHTQRQQR